MSTFRRNVHQVAKQLPITLEFVRDQNAGRIAQSFEQLTEKVLGRMPVAPVLHQDIERVTVLVNFPPQVMMLSFDGQYHLVEMPLVTALWLLAA